MTMEAAKTNKIRTNDFFSLYFTGRVVDIGCGDDLVVAHAEPFDLPQGDAQNILDYLEAESYDCVHSSHCLEHMKDPVAALSQWWALVKPGGYMVIVVPDEELYEQGFFPSLFNLDHKATFRLSKYPPLTSRSFAIDLMVSELPNALLMSAERQDEGYDYNLIRRAYSKWGWFIRFESSLWKKRLSRLGFKEKKISSFIDRFFYRLGAPIDQTLGPAVAQIQIVAQKRDPSGPKT